MGKITGFLEIERKDKLYKPVKERLRILTSLQKTLIKKLYLLRVLVVWIVEFHTVILVVL